MKMIAGMTAEKSPSQGRCPFCVRACSPTTLLSKMFTTPDGAGLLAQHPFKGLQLALAHLVQEGIDGHVPAQVRLPRGHELVEALRIVGDGARSTQVRVTWRGMSAWNAPPAIWYGTPLMAGGSPMAGTFVMSFLPATVCSVLTTTL
jgi:hypothetical protein